MVSWMSRKKDFVALSTIEAEYMVASEVSREVVWLCKLLVDLFEGLLDSIIILCDNRSCIKLLENAVFHARSKHIIIKYHYFLIMVQDGSMKLQYIFIDE